ncbi:NAD(P)-binding protein [Segnochrobactrum spirostomi]|nr:NAD(P)-binding protein [Segnochrobactrum spirostomi]
MPRSIYRLLHRRYGTTSGVLNRISAARPGLAAGERASRVAAGKFASDVDEIEAIFGTLAEKKPFSGKTLAVIGGGFAGLSAAYAAAVGGAYVTLYEATPNVGGRVQSDYGALAPARIVERGAELIGLIHPVWLFYARLFGLGMVSIDTGTYLDAVDIVPEIFLNGEKIESANLSSLYEDYTHFQSVIWESAKDIDPLRPWDSGRDLDGISFKDWIVKALDGYIQKYPRSLAMFLAEMENDNVMPTDQQSALGFLAQIAAGGATATGEARFFADVELFRCDQGNQALAESLLNAIEAKKMEIMRSMPIGKIVIPTAAEAKVDLYGFVRYEFGNSYWGTPNPHNYVVFAAPTSLSVNNNVTLFEGGLR